MQKSLVQYSHVPESFRDDIEHHPLIVEAQKIYASLVSEPAISAGMKKETLAVVKRMFNTVEKENIRNNVQATVMYYAVGTLLNATEDKFPCKTDYMCWLRSSFGKEHHLEALRQAKKIARLGPAILELSPLGKNRSLELYYLLKEHYQDEPYENLNAIGDAVQAVLKKYYRSAILPDIHLIDNDPKDIRIAVDCIITIYRLGVAGIDEQIFTYDQVKMLALFRGLAIEKKQASALAKWINNDALHPELQDKKLAFDTYLKDRMHIPSSSTDVRPMSIGQLMASFQLWYSRHQNDDVTNKDIETLRRSDRARESLKKMYRNIQRVAERAGIDLLADGGS